MSAISGETLRNAGPPIAVGAVLAPGECRGLRVGRGVGERVDAGAANGMVGERIGVHGDEELRPGPLGARHPVLERNEIVARAGQHHAIGAAGLQAALEFERGGEGDMLLVGAGIADRTRILAAMAGVEHDHGGRARRRPLPLGRVRRRGGGPGRQQQRCRDSLAEQKPAGTERRGAHGRGY